MCTKPNKAAYSRVVATDVQQKSHWSSRSIKYLSFLGESVPPDSTTRRAPAVIKQSIVIMEKNKVNIRRFWEKVVEMSEGGLGLELRSSLKKIQHGGNKIHI